MPVPVARVGKSNQRARWNRVQDGHYYVAHRASTVFTSDVHLEHQEGLRDRACRTDRLGDRIHKSRTY